MDSRKRLEYFLKGKVVDRIGLYPFLLGFSAKNVGYSISTIYNNPEKSFEAQIKTIEQYGFELWPTFGYASYGAWEFGGSVKMPEGQYEQAPSVTNYPVKSVEDVYDLKLPDPRISGSIPLAMEFAHLQSKINIPITPIFGGNFTMAGNICSPTNLCRWMMKKPELVHHIMKVTTHHIIESVKYWVDKFGAEQVIPQFWEPLAANNVISPKQFRDFVFVYLKESSNEILKMGVKHIFYHICGEHNLNLQYWAQIPMGDPGICSIGKEVDIDTAIKYLGKNCIIIGNIDTKIIKNGTSEELYDVCKATIIKGKKAPRGFMLSSACETPPESPPYNVYIMQKAVNEYGWYK